MKRKNRFISIILVVMMLLATLSAGFTAFAAEVDEAPGESETPATVAEADRNEVPIYWARSQEWTEDEMAQEQAQGNNPVLMLKNSGATYKLPTLLACEDTPEYKYSALNIAYADSALFSEDAIKLIAGDEAGAAIWNKYKDDPKKPDMQYGIKYVWDGGYADKDAQNAVIGELYFTDYTAEGGAKTYKYENTNDAIKSLPMNFVGNAYDNTKIYAPGSVIKGSDGEYYRYVGEAVADAAYMRAPILGTAKGEVLNGWECLELKESENYDDPNAYDRKYGRYYTFSDKFSRDGPESKPGEWCTWSAHNSVNKNKENSTVRRFTGYFYLPENTDKESLYLALSDGAQLIAADDTVMVYINGHPLYAVTTRAAGDGITPIPFTMIGDNNIADFNYDSKKPNETNLFHSAKNGYDNTGTPYSIPCNEPKGTGSCVVQPVQWKATATGAFQGWILNKKDADGKIIPDEYVIDSKTDRIANGEKFEQGEDFGTYQDQNYDNHDYSFAAYWHVHTSEAKYDVAQYLNPGEANRIDIIAGDHTDGGGMTRLHLFASGKTNESSEVQVEVNGYVNNDNDSDAPFDEKVSPDFDENHNVVEDGDAKPQPAGTSVYYEYIIRNPKDSAALNGITFKDNNLGLTFSGTGILKDKKDADGNIVTEPVTFDTAEIKTGDVSENWSEAGAGTAIAGDTAAEQLKNALASLKAGDSIRIRIPVAKGEHYTEGQVDTYVALTADSTAGEVNASSSTYVIMFSATENDWVVVDFGLPVELDVLHNDKFGDYTDCEVSSLAAGEHLKDDGAEFTNPVQGAYGQLSIASEKNKVRYIPTQFINSEDVFTYESSYNSGNQHARATVTVIPATTVYYEDNFNAGKWEDYNNDKENPAIIYDGNWSTVNNSGEEDVEPDSVPSVDDVNQSADNSSAGDNKENYGQDPVYNDENNTHFSFGSAHIIGGAEDAEAPLTIDKYNALPQFNGNETFTEDGYTYKKGSFVDMLWYKSRHLHADFPADSNTAKVYFTFSGTGFDIISYTNNNSGILNCDVYAADSVADDNGKISPDKIANATSLKSLSVSNYFEVPNTTLYQIPVIAVRNLDYNTYTVVLTVEGKRLYPSTGNVVVIDGIRIYNPLENGSEHYTPAEQNAVIYEVRDLLTGKVSANNHDLNGNRIALAGTENVYIGAQNGGVDLEQYNMNGPKNELYITSVGTGIQFKYDPTKKELADKLTLQLEAKSLGGKTRVTAFCYYNKESTPANGPTASAPTTAYHKSKTFEVNNSTQTYYDLTSILPEIPQQCIIEIYKAGEETTETVYDPNAKNPVDSYEKAGTILSLTTLKITDGVILSSETDSLLEPVTPIPVALAFEPKAIDIYAGNEKFVPVTVRVKNHTGEITDLPEGATVSVENLDGFNVIVNGGKIELQAKEGTEPKTYNIPVTCTYKVGDEVVTLKGELPVKVNAMLEDVIADFAFFNKTTNEIVKNDSTLSIPAGTKVELIPMIKYKATDEWVWQQSEGITLDPANIDYSDNYCTVTTEVDPDTGRYTYTVEAKDAHPVGESHSLSVTASMNLNPTDTHEAKVNIIVIADALQELNLTSDKTELTVGEDAAATLTLNATYSESGEQTVEITDDMLDYNRDILEFVDGALKVKEDAAVETPTDVTITATVDGVSSEPITITVKPAQTEKPFSGTVTIIPVVAKGSQYIYGAWINNLNNITGDSQAINNIQSVTWTDRSNKYFGFTSKTNAWVNIPEWLGVEIKVTDNGAECSDVKFTGGGTVTYPNPPTEWAKLKRIGVEQNATNPDTVDYVYELRWTEGADPEIDVESITVKPESVTLTGKETATLEATVLPEGADPTVTWSSSNDAIVTVVGGVLTPVGVGTATITATAVGGKTAEATVTVQEVDYEIEFADFDMDDNTTKELTPGFNVDNDEFLSVPTFTKWESNNTSVATVENGKVTAHKPGTAKITVTDSNGESATATVTVKAVNVEKVTINERNVTIKSKPDGTFTNVTKQFTATVTPANATDKTVTWSVDDEAVATINPETGVLTPIKEGDVKVTATSNDNQSVTDTVAVKIEMSYAVTDIGIYAQNDENGNTKLTALDDLTSGETVTIRAVVKYNGDKTDNAAVWSAEPDILTFANNDDGTVTVTAGTVTTDTTVKITVTADDDSTKTYDVSVTVKPIKVESITISGLSDPDEDGNYHLTVGDKGALTATVSPANAGNKAVEWRSDDSDVVSVDANGNVEAKGEGTATVTATAKDGSDVKASITIVVEESGGGDEFTPFNVTIQNTAKGKTGHLFTHGTWYETNTFVTSIAEHTNKDITVPGDYWYLFVSGGGDSLYWASQNQFSEIAMKLHIDDDGSYSYNIFDATATDVQSNWTFKVSVGSSATAYHISETWDANHTTLTLELQDGPDPANAMLVKSLSEIAPSSATLVGNGPAILGVAEDGRMTDIDTAAAYTMLTDAGVTPHMVASLGYSLTAKEGYTLLEDAVKSLVFEGDTSDVIVVSINDAMTLNDSAADLIPAMESLLNTLHTLSPNAKILLVGSRGAYNRYMAEAVANAELGDTVFFMEDTSSALIGEQAVIEQEELTTQIAQEVARILSLDEASEIPADAWATITVYSEGDIVLYNGVKYECVMAHVSKNNSYNPEQNPDYWQVIS